VEAYCTDYKLVVVVGHLYWADIVVAQILVRVLAKVADKADKTDQVDKADQVDKIDKADQADKIDKIA
jgi:hypothetical protein